MRRRASGTRARTAPGVIEETPFGKFTVCYLCGQSYMVNREGLILPHDKSFGEGPCPNAWGAADLASAILRDEKLTDEEQYVKGRVYSWLIQCKGSQTLSDGSSEPCWHPICRERLEKGLHWTMTGWKSGP